MKHITSRLYNYILCILYTYTFAKKQKQENKMKQYDHKENFKTKSPCRLINPAKSEIGIVSNVEIKKINRTITNQTKCNQWRNTQAVIDRFNSMPNKTKHGL